MMNKTSIVERRKFERTSAAIRVEMTHPSIGAMVGSTMDISDGGAQVFIDSSHIPPVGTVVNVIFKKMVGQVNVNPVPMKVMHAHKNVIGLMFVR